MAQHRTPRPTASRPFAGVVVLAAVGLTVVATAVVLVYMACAG